MRYHIRLNRHPDTRRHPLSKNWNRLVWVGPALMPLSCKRYGIGPMWVPLYHLLLLVVKVVDEVRPGRVIREEEGVVWPLVLFEQLVVKNLWEPRVVQWYHPSLHLWYAPYLKNIVHPTWIQDLQQGWKNDWIVLHKVLVLENKVEMIYAFLIWTSITVVMRVLLHLWRKWTRKLALKKHDEPTFLPFKVKLRIERGKMMMKLDYLLDHGDPTFNASNPPLHPKLPKLLPLMKRAIPNQKSQRHFHKDWLQIHPHSQWICW
mmetsp:Transcript_21536/g.30170  ORF Transcript_21536/g.30170 Transcript_21536/m.30170 type:complete len:261 (+) Transcript_21536:1186-1968(+)